MSANIRIITPNDGDSATLSVATLSMSASLPIANLQDQARERVGRTTNTTGGDIKGTWSAAKAISACVLNRHNMTSAATWRVRLYSDAAWTTLVYDSGTLSMLQSKSLGDLVWGVDPLGSTLFDDWDWAFSQMFFTAVIAQSFKITIADAANPDGYLEWSRLFIGCHVEPVCNFDFGAEFTWVDDSTQERTEGGSLRTDGVEPCRQFKFSLAWLDLSDRPKFAEWARRDGKRNDVWVALYPDDLTSLGRDNAMAAKLIDSPLLKHAYSQTFQGEYTVQEA